MGSDVFLEGQARPPIPTGLSALNFGDDNSNQILHGNESRWEENFKGSATPPAWSKLLTRMLMRDLFAAANVLSCFLGNVHKFVLGPE